MPFHFLFADFRAAIVMLREASRLVGRMSLPGKLKEGFPLLALNVCVTVDHKYIVQTARRAVFLVEASPAASLLPSPHLIRVVIAREGFPRGKACFGANRSTDDRVGNGAVCQGSGTIVDDGVCEVDLVQEGCNLVVSNFTDQNPTCV